MTSPSQSRATVFISYLSSLVEREDRGALAALRLGLGKEPGSVPEMYRHVEPFLSGAGQQQSDAAYLLASLFGLYSVVWEKPAEAPWNTSFGWSLNRIRLRDGGAEEDEGVARRFTAMLGCDREALSNHMRQLVSLLHSRADDAQIDWERLYWDIVDWDDIDRRVQRRWAEAFWRGRPEPPIAEENREQGVEQ